MKHEKVTVKIISNDEMDQDELQRNWNLFLDIVLKKEIAKKETPVVGREEGKL